MEKRFIFVSALFLLGLVIAANDTGIVQIIIEDQLRVVIYSPENTTYNFNKGEPYIIELNVSADFDVEPINGWKYSLYDLRHDYWVEQDTFFTPNSSISAVRWENLLVVYALSDGGEWANSSVVFYVNVSNSAPILGHINDTILVCEGEELEYRFNATDVDEDALIGDISPRDPFYLTGVRRNLDVSFFDIISGTLDKSDLGVHSETVSVRDPYDEVDTKDVDIEVIEINSEPLLENLGAQTVWLSGDNSSFYKIYDAEDSEDGLTSDGNLEFNLTWGGDEDLFEIGATDGVMNYTPEVGHEGRVYDLEICVEDNPLGNVHDNISLCSNDGSENVVCDTFTLTVTDDNRAPEIINYTPLSDVFSTNARQFLDFYVEVYDADGTIPDIDWYVDDSRVEHNENLSNDTFSYRFACDAEGAHSIMASTTDGLLNDTQTWSIDVEPVKCPSSSGGGGGGGGGKFCVESWFCNDWEVCQNVQRSFDSEAFSLEDYYVLKGVCSQNGEEDERFCGFQITSCHDLNVCERDEPIIPRPVEKRFCYFTENPSCSDGITNCHDGACELLSDCGGPCEACSTCSDGVHNQGEEDVDCGGPCPFQCEPEVPFAVLSTILITLLIILIIIILIVLYRLFFMWKRRRDEEKKA